MRLHPTTHPSMDQQVWVMLKDVLVFFNHCSLVEATSVDSVPTSMPRLMQLDKEILQLKTLMTAQTIWWNQRLKETDVIWIQNNAKFQTQAFGLCYTMVKGQKVKLQGKIVQKTTLETVVLFQLHMLDEISTPFTLRKFLGWISLACLKETMVSLGNAMTSPCNHRHLTS